MKCESCKYWEKHHSSAAHWGDCSMLASGEGDEIDFYTNNREGEWVETHVETLPEFFCKLYKEKEEEDGSIDGTK